MDDRGLSMLVVKRETSKKEEGHQCRKSSSSYCQGEYGLGVGCLDSPGTVPYAKRQAREGECRLKGEVPSDPPVGSE